MTVIGITGTDGAGKGETVRGTVARPCQQFFELAKTNSDKVYCSCKQVFFYGTRKLSVCKHPDTYIVCKSKERKCPLHSLSNN